VQHAPSVNYPVGRSVFQAALAALLGGLSGCVVLIFAQRNASVASISLLTLGWLLASAWAGWACLRSPSGWLQWQAGQWFLNGEAGITTLIQDFSMVVLVRWQTDATGHKTQWLWLERNQLPAEWLGLRRALYSPQISPLQQPI
jgi:hypothetical protein